MKYASVAVAMAGAAAAETYSSIAWEPIATSTSTTWTTWDPETSTTWTTWDPKETSTSSWTTWDPKETSSTTWTTWDPKETTTTSWSAWEAYPTTTTTTKSTCTYTTVVPTTKCDDKNHCWADKYTSTIYADTCTWSDWDPKTSTSTTWSAWEAYPTTTTTSKCSYVTAVPTTYCVKDHTDKCWSDSYTTTMYADTCTWAAWSTPVTPTSTTTGKCSYVTPVTTSKCAPGHSDWCVPVTYTSTMYADTCTWASWTPKSTPVDETTTWSTWEPVAETSTWSSWEPVDETVTVTWASWSTSTPVMETSTSTWASWSVVTSDVTPGWSSAGWFGPAWPTATAGECVKNVVTSYGAPIWKPTPVMETSTTKATTWATIGATSTGHAAIAPAGNKWSMTYSPYTAAGVCKAVADIKVDLEDMSSLGFTTVRIYSTDCHLLEVVTEVYESCGLKVILGVFIDKTGVKGAAQQVTDILAWAKWECVELIVVGNEAVFQGFCTAAELVAFISECKAKFVAAGYSGPCTTTEPLAQWQSYGSQFCGVVDVVAANLYAFFNSDCPAEKAGTFIASEITILEGICPKKDVYVMECGWPSEGSCNGAACPGVEQQAVAIKAIQEECGEQIVFFSFEDETWKQPGQFGVEQHWGCSEVFGTAKPSATTTWASWSALPTTTTTSTWAAWETN